MRSPVKAPFCLFSSHRQSSPSLRHSSQIRATSLFVLFNSLLPTSPLFCYLNCINVVPSNQLSSMSCVFFLAKAIDRQCPDRAIFWKVYVVKFVTCHLYFRGQLLFFFDLSNNLIIQDGIMGNKYNILIQSFLYNFKISTFKLILLMFDYQKRIMYTS